MAFLIDQFRLGRKVAIVNRLQAWKWIAGQTIHVDGGRVARP